MIVTFLHQINCSQCESELIYSIQRYGEWFHKFGSYRYLVKSNSYKQQLSKKSSITPKIEGSFYLPPNRVQFSHNQYITVLRLIVNIQSGAERWKRSRKG
jgi:hypothetical protein